jgi:hypothetical protein
MKEEEERGMKLLLVTTLIYLPTETNDRIISLIITLKNNDVSFYQWNHQHIYIFLIIFIMSVISSLIIKKKFLFVIFLEFTDEYFPSLLSLKMIDKTFSITNSIII